MSSWGLPCRAGPGAPGHHGGQAGHQRRAGDSCACAPRGESPTPPHLPGKHPGTMGPGSVWASQPHQEKLWGRRVPPTWTPGTQACPGEAQPSYQPTGSLMPPPCVAAVGTHWGLLPRGCLWRAGSLGSWALPQPPVLPVCSPLGLGQAFFGEGGARGGPRLLVPLMGTLGSHPLVPPTGTTVAAIKATGTAPPPPQARALALPHPGVASYPAQGWTQAGPSPAPAHLISPETSRASQSMAVRL